MRGTIADLHRSRLVNVSYCLFSQLASLLIPVSLGPLVTGYLLGKDSRPSVVSNRSTLFPAITFIHHLAWPSDDLSGPSFQFQRQTHCCALYVFALTIGRLATTAYASAVAQSNPPLTPVTTYGPFKPPSLPLVAFALSASEPRAAQPPSTAHQCRLTHLPSALPRSIHELRPEAGRRSIPCDGRGRRWRGAQGLSPGSPGKDAGCTNEVPTPGYFKDHRPPAATEPACLAILPG